MRGRRWLFVLLAAAFAARLAFCWKFPQALPGGGVPDYDHYQRLAMTFLQHGSMLDDFGAKSAAREPGYPAVLAALYLATGPRYWAVCLLHALMGALTVWLVFSLGVRVFGPLTGWLAALMAAFHPQLLYYAALPRRETFQTLLLAASVWTLLDACEKPAAGRILLSALVWAVNPLTNAAFFPAGLAAAAAFVLIGWQEKPRAQRAAGLYLAAFLTIYGLWPARNALVFHRFIPGMDEGGNHIYVGLAVPNDVAGTPEEQKIDNSDPVMVEASRLPPSQREAVYYRGAVQWIREHPVLFLGRLWESFIKLWRLYPYPRDYGMSYGLIKRVSLLSDGWIIPFALAGLLLAWRRHPETVLFNLVLGSVTLTYMVFWSIIRYRIPLMPLVFLYAAYALARLYEGLLKGPFGRRMG